MGKNDSTVKELQEKGNECMKQDKHLEAVLNYTFAIKRDLRNAELYNKRSTAFLKTHQYYYALEDANQVIKLKPKWAQGYFQKAEVLFAAQQYSDAIKMYQEVLRFQPGDQLIVDKMEKAVQELTKMQRQMQRLPWLGLAAGLFIGLMAVIFHSTSTSTFQIHPFFQVVFILICSGIGYGIATFIRKLSNSYRDSLLEKPIDLFGDGDK